MNIEKLEILFKVMDAEEYIIDELNDRDYLEDRVDAILEMFEINTLSETISDLVELYLKRIN